MTRLASVVVAIIVVFVSSPAAAQDPAAAQGMALMVSVPSAAVRKSPSMASPVVGQAPRGAVLDVTRDVGSWVKVTWPDAPDGVGYVHESMGTLSNRQAAALVGVAPMAADSGRWRGPRRVAGGRKMVRCLLSESVQYQWR